MPLRSICHGVFPSQALPLRRGTARPPAGPHQAFARGFGGGGGRGGVGLFVDAGGGGGEGEGRGRGQLVVWWFGFGFEALARVAQTTFLGEVYWKLQV